MNENLITYIKQNIASEFKAEFEFLNEEASFYINTENLKSALKKLRDDRQTLFSMLVSICGVDYPEREKRFEVVYNLLSLKHNARIKVKIQLDEKEKAPSVSDLFNSATWYERETFDMYGIIFTDAKDNRRILTDYGFKHFPLRKDFPLTGYEEMRYDIEKKKVAYEPVKLDQQYRNFDFLSPWEGVSDLVLPGDEKVAANQDKK